LLPSGISFRGVLSQPSVMMLRNVTQHPVRAALTIVGMAFSTGILIVSLFINDAMDELIDVTYFMADRQDATVSFVEKRPHNAVLQMARLPGVLNVEPYRGVPVRVRNGSVERRVMIDGRTRVADLSRIVDVDLRPVVLPETGLAISDWLASVLGVGVGDFVEIDILEGQRRTVSLPVAARVEDYFGISGMMDADALSRLMREAPTVNGVHLSLDESMLEPLYDALKVMPAVSGVALQRVSLTNFRQAMVTIVTTMAAIYTGLAAVIAFGVVYNSARISLSERARELASLRVLGFSRAETLRFLLLELALFTFIAQPPGWAIGYGLAWLLNANMAGELMRTPLNIEHATYVFATLVVLAAATLSALVMRRRIDRLDIVAVLKTRD
jgi:putative ABC transport system permease protein